ncbi:MAG: hypothetical protein QGG73_01630 [Candidatus Hydrogenedentes bacterium]|jgi:hypothetical protein|nr:hypothetical protein [Candidatus Hydrogenedentota bacterium]
MLTPEDILSDTSLERDDLAANTYYLHDSGLVEVMVGYSPPLFAAARITSAGIDLVEDAVALNARFPTATEATSQRAMGALACVLELAREIEVSALDGVRRDWLLEDVQRLRDELRKPMDHWDGEAIWNGINWVGHYFEGAPEDHLSTLAPLAKAVRSILGVRESTDEEAEGE